MTSRYVVLRHSEIAEPHFDVMFDTGDDSPLVTWRSLSWPITGPTPLIRLPDHRREYLTYEGELSANRGRVVRVASGPCELQITPNRWTARIGSTELTITRHNGDYWSADANEPA